MDKFPRNTLVQNIYDREEERKIIITALEEASNGKANVLFINGFSGTGKTTVVNNSIRSMLSNKIYYVSGKYHQFNNDEPYFAFVQAFRNLIKQVLTESKTSIEIWRKKLVKELGKNGAILIDILPELEIIIGPQSSVEKLDPEKTKLRFNKICKVFLRVFCKEGYTIVIFLDDLQWADLASLELLKYLCQDLKNNILIILAYRQEEIINNEGLRTTIEGIKKENSEAKSMVIKNLNLNSTQKLIRDTFYFKMDEIIELSKVIYGKTMGNPFFIKQFLEMIYDENYLYFNKNKNSWEYDLVHIKNLNSPDNLVQLVIEKMNKLSKEEIKILKLASCIGYNFESEILSLIYDKKTVQVEYQLKGLIDEGYILPKYEFLHDKVYEAAYALVSDEEKKHINFKIGQAILKNYHFKETDKKIMKIMNYLNFASDLVDDNVEKIKFAKYNLLSARKANANAAYYSALSYLKHGIDFLVKNSWKEYFELTYELYLECAKCEYLTGNFEEANKLFKILLSKAKSELQIVEIHVWKMTLYSCKGENHDSIESGLEALKHLGISLPKKASNLYKIKELIMIKYAFYRKVTNKSTNLTEFQVSSPINIIKAMEILTILAAPTHIVDPNLFDIVLLKLSFLTGKYGVNQYTSIGYSVYALLVGSLIGNYKESYEIEKMALKLESKYKNDSIKCINKFILGSFVSHWTQFVEISLDYLEEAIFTGIENGEFLYAGYSISNLLEIKHFMGRNLQEVYEESCKYMDFAENMNFKTVLNSNEIFTRFVESLKKTEEPVIYENLEFEKQMEENKNNEIMSYYQLKIQYDYLLGNYQSALATEEKVQKNLDLIMGYIISAENNFYHSLTITAVYENSENKKKAEFFKVLKNNRVKMKKWAENCPQNFSHKYLLVEAEINRILGNNENASHFYDLAIKDAYDNGFIQNEAIANELAGKFYFSLGREKIAGVYLNEACKIYHRWGAFKKENKLKDEFENIVNQVYVINNDEDNFIETGSKEIVIDKINTNNKRLDLVVNLLKNINEEKEIEKVLTQFLEIAMETAGAYKGYILIEKDDDLYIEASKGEKLNSIKPGHKTLFEDSEDMAKDVVRYVSRTNEIIIINEKKNNEIFIRDSYIKKHKIISILCMPLLFHNIFVGVLYLENPYNQGIFTEEKVEVAKVIAYHMASIKKIQHLLDKEKVNSNAKIDDTIIPLTEREKEVLQYISKGLSNKKIADCMDLKLSTTKTHILNIYSKLHVNRRVQAVIKAKELGIL